MFQRRHYEEVARIIRGTRGCVGPAQSVHTREVDSLARVFAANFQQGNANFDRARFLRACGVEG